MTSASAFTEDFDGPRPSAAAIGAVTGLALYAALAAFATLIAPPALAIFLAPPLLLIALKAPRARPCPERFVRFLIVGGIALLALWPVYVHLKIGPAPILTPARLVIYALTACWLYDMTVSRQRRARLVHALTRGRAVAAPVFALFALGGLGLFFAQGKAIAAAEYLRQLTIWFLPFLAAATYVRRRRHLEDILRALAVAAALSGAVAVLEAASGKLLANLLLPFAAEDSQWLQNVQEQKIRDGVFRAQAGHTHPLSLGEYLAFAAPLVLGLVAAARTRRARLLWLGAFTLIVGGAIATQSRGAAIALCVGAGTYLAVSALRFLRRAGASRFKPLAGLATLLLIAASPALVAGGYAMVAGEAGEQAARSSQSRVDQMEQAWPKIAKRPLTGYGSGRATRVLGYWGTTLTIDNYYLSLALDLGVLGPLVFVSMLVGAGLSVGGVSAHGPPASRSIMLGLACALAAFALTRGIVSLTGNLSILYLVLGAMTGVVGRIKAEGRTRRLMQEMAGSRG